jgi:hypothetical protein
VVAIRRGEGSFHCFELPVCSQGLEVSELTGSPAEALAACSQDSSFAEADADKLRVVPGCKTLQTYRDSDGMLW